MVWSPNYYPVKVETAVGRGFDLVRGPGHSRNASASMEGPGWRRCPRPALGEAQDAGAPGGEWVFSHLFNIPRCP